MLSRLGLVALVITLATSAMTFGPDLTSSAGAADDIALTCFPHAQTDALRYDNTWGARRSGGRRHKGIDIMSPKGLEVRAVADGVVETLGNGRSSGYYVRLVHAGGWETWYMHLANDTPGTDDGRGGTDTAYAEGLTEGRVVHAGEVIGYVGDSGNAEWTGSHTHFELHMDGRAVNPYPYLAEAQEREDTARSIVVDLVFTPSDRRPEALLSTVRTRLADLGVSSCLPDSHGDAVRQVYGELPGERPSRIQSQVR